MMYDESNLPFPVSIYLKKYIPICEPEPTLSDEVDPSPEIFRYNKCVRI